MLYEVVSYLSDTHQNAKI